jgi:hypothetical protein
MCLSNSALWLPSEDFGMLNETFDAHFYPSQTKILDGRTNVSECFLEALFKGVRTRFGLQIVEKCFEKAF